jgi:hypothetical protein
VIILYENKMLNKLAALIGSLALYAEKHWVLMATVPVGIVKIPWAVVPSTHYKGHPLRKYKSNTSLNTYVHNHSESSKFLR